MTLNKHALRNPETQKSDEDERKPRNKKRGEKTTTTMSERNLLLDEGEVAGELRFTSERRISWRKMKRPSHAGKKERRKRESWSWHNKQDV